MKHKQKIEMTPQAEEKTPEQFPQTAKKHKKRSQKIFLRGCLFSFLCVVLVGGGFIWLGIINSRYPSSINMGPAGYMTMNGKTMYMGEGTPVTSLQAPQTAKHIDTFTLTAEVARIKLGNGTVVSAWTYNGTAPGPTLRVRQGDLVIVHLVNHLPVGVTIHWHGVSVPNAADGVAGVTQDAVKPGQSYTYRFIAKDAGTYWYHSHQESYEETGQGLYGVLIVDPTTPTEHDDIDEAVALHTWNGNLAINQTTGTLPIEAKAGDWVRLRIVNASIDQQMMALIGTPFRVIALDGHDLNGPTPLTKTLLPIGAGQRYDLRFQMPQNGAVILLTANDNGQLQQSPTVVLGSSGTNTSIALSSHGYTKFDFTSYGRPRPDPITIHSHFDVTDNITLGMMPGFSNGRMGMTYTINGKTFPDTPSIVVQPDQLVRFHMVNNSGDIHPMHLHGHTFAVLSRNGHPLTGSPVYLDTINIQPHEVYDIAFYANNPGLWMMHCHNLRHANWGMDMMVVYPHISTPYTIGSASGNFPD